MGVDWCKMRLKTKDIDLLKQLIEEQALGWQEWEQTAQYDTMRFEARIGYWYFASRMPYYQHILGLDVSKERGFKRYREASNKLQELLDIPEYNGSKDLRDYTSIRIAFFNPIFPHRWCINAYRSYLPDELPEMYKKCKDYLDLVHAGSYRDYLFHDYLYLNSHFLYGIWHYLRYPWIKLVKKCTKSWANNVKSTDLIERIIALPKPVTYSHVRWEDWEHNISSTINYKNDERYLGIHRAMEEILLLKRDIHKAKGKYTSLRNAPVYYEVSSFEDYLAFAFSPSLQTLFKWWRSCIDEGYGLFLWY